MNRATIIIIAFLLSISFTGNQPPQAQTAQKFKVAVYVVCDNAIAKRLMESYIKRELRSLGDVQVVGNSWENPLWEYMISLHASEIKYKSGQSTELLAICYKEYDIVPYTRFNGLWLHRYKQFPAIHIPTGGIAYYPIDKLDEFCKGTVAEFDTEKLQRDRDFRN